MIRYLSKSYHKGLEASFVISADFEAINEKVHGCRPNTDTSYQKHKVCGYGNKVVCCYDDKYSKPVQIYRRENAAWKMLEEVEWCKKNETNIIIKI